MPSDTTQDPRQPTGPTSGSSGGRRRRPARAQASGPSERTLAVLRRAFHQANRQIVLPMLDSPLGPWMGSPASGYFLVLTTRGRRTGLPRRTPLNYALLDGHIYLLAGFGPKTDWYRNLVAEAQVEVGLPGRAVTGTATTVSEPAEWSRATVAVTRNAGLALAFQGLNPLTTSDSQILLSCSGLPVVRIQTQTPVFAGPHDPGPLLWVIPHVVIPAAVAVATAGVVARPRRGGSPARG